MSGHCICADHLTGPYGPDQGTWETIADVELAPIAWVRWFNTRGLHGYLDDILPAESEDAYHFERSGNQLGGNR